MTAINLVFGTYFVRSFTNVDSDYTGYNVYDGVGNCLGEMVCDHYDDLEDEESLEEFENELEEWLKENE
jgi:hypothetical protein